MTLLIFQVCPGTSAPQVYLSRPFCLTAYFLKPQKIKTVQLLLTSLPRSIFSPYVHVTYDRQHRLHVMHNQFTNKRNACPENWRQRLLVKVTNQSMIRKSSLHFVFIIHLSHLSPFMYSSLSFFYFLFCLVPTSWNVSLAKFHYLPKNLVSCD